MATRRSILLVDKTLAATRDRLGKYKGDVKTSLSAEVPSGASITVTVEDTADAWLLTAKCEVAD